MENEYSESQQAFLTRDYELKVQYLMHHFNSMWRRFNYFLAADSALILIYSQDKIIALNPALLFVFGLGISLLWYSFSVQDRYVVEVYRLQVARSHELVQKSLNLKVNIDYAGYTPRGKTDEIRTGLLKWRNKKLSITQSAAMLPLFYLLFWLYSCANSILMSQSANFLDFGSF